VTTHVAGLQQGLIPGEPIGSDGSQQPCCGCAAGAESVQEPHPPRPPEHPSLESAGQQAIVGIEPIVAERQPVYDQPSKG
jgi:hypothetical protein